MNATKDPVKINVLCAPFSGQGPAYHDVMVEADGSVLVWDAVAQAYTRCHSLANGTCIRIRKLAAFTVLAELPTGVVAGGAVHRGHSEVINTELCYYAKAVGNMQGENTILRNFVLTAKLAASTVFCEVRNSHETKHSHDA